MKKVLLAALLCTLVVTGCGEKEKDALLGNWKTSYELGDLGTITESYEFKEKGVCTRTLNAGSDIVDECTYEFNEDKTQIRIVWDDKLDKESYSSYSMNGENEVTIAGRVFARQ